MLQMNIQDAIVGQIFDTTASNTGKQKGAASRIEVLLNRPILWLACRHNTGELHVGWVYEACRGNKFTKKT